METLKPSDAVEVFVQMADSPLEDSRIGVRFCLPHGVGMEVYLPLLVAKELFERLAEYRERFKGPVTAISFIEDFIEQEPPRPMAPPMVDFAYEDQPIAGGGIFHAEDGVVAPGDEVLTERVAHGLLFGEQYKARRAQDDRIRGYIDEFVAMQAPPPPLPDAWPDDEIWLAAERYAVRKLIESGEHELRWHTSIGRVCPSIHGRPDGIPLINFGHRASSLWRSVEAEVMAEAAVKNAEHEKFARDHLAT